MSINRIFQIPSSPVGQTKTEKSKYAAAYVDYFSLPNPATSISPLKRRFSRISAASEKREPPPSCKKLRFDEEPKVTDNFLFSEELELKSEIQALTPQLEEVLDLMESYVKENNKTAIMLAEMRPQIVNILNNAQLSEEKKLAELGTAFFYLTSKKDFPRQGSFLSGRLGELESVADALKVEHREICDKMTRRTLPSGVVIYLKRAYARMIFTQEGSFNLGGCYAVQELLTSRLTPFLSEEIRNQMCSIVERLINDKKFCNLIMAKTPLDPRFEETIRIEMKLSPNEPISFVHVRWAILINLFTVTIQGEEPNCFTEAAGSKLFNDNADLIVCCLKHVLERGRFQFEGIDLPIEPLLETFKHFETGFQYSLKKEEAVRLTAFSVAHRLINGEETPGDQDERQIVLQALMEEQFPDNLDYAEKIFLSHKVSYLHQLTLSILQFIALNSSAPRSEINPDTTCVSWKRKIFDELKIKFQQAYEKDCVAPELLRKKSIINYLIRFDFELRNRFFLIDAYSEKGVIDQGRVKFNRHNQGLIFEGNLEDYTPCENIRRLYYLKEGSLKAIDALDDLAKCFIEVLRDVRSKRNKKDWWFFKIFFKSDLFKTIISNYLEELNSQVKVNFSWKKYYDSNSFFLIQNGGDAFLINLWEDLKSHYQQAVYFSANDPIDFLQKLCHQITQYVVQKPEYAVKTDPLLLCMSPSHSFNFTPCRFKKYWDNDRLIESKVIQPAEAILNNTISEDLKKRIIFFTLLSRDAFGQFYQPFANQEMTFKEFIAQVLAKLDPERHPLFRKMLTIGVLQIRTSTVADRIVDIMEGNGKELDETELLEIQAFITKKIGKRSDIHPHRLANIFQKAALSCSQPMYIPRWELEGTIRKIYHLPDFVELGSLNWSPSHEKPRFTRLGLGFDFLNHKVVFFERERGNEKLLEDGLARNILEKTALCFDS